MKFELITTFFDAQDKTRVSEITECFVRNNSNPLIEKIHIISETAVKEEIQQLEKVLVTSVKQRPKFSALFRYANELPSENIRIIANSDIYFDASLVLAKEGLKKWNVLALTRWDRLNTGVIEYYNNFKSQDTWIFNQTIPTSIGGYFIGQPACDNRLLAEFKTHNITFGNPSLEIITTHLHQSNLRTYNKHDTNQSVPLPYEYALPVKLKEITPKDLKKYLYISRYKYYKSLSNNTLLSTRANLLGRLCAFLKSKYWAFLFNSN